MSYILDALRKSEQQRTLGAVPTLPATWVAAVPDRSSMLFHALSGLLVIVAAVTAVAWARPWAPEPATPAISSARSRDLPARQIAPVASPPAPAALAAPPSVVAPPSAPMSLQTAVAPDLPRKASAPARIATLTPAPRPAARAPSDDAPQGNSGSTPELPISLRKQLPPMSVAVHAYSTMPEDRLVSINGRMLREGDALAPELKLEQITPEGMVFTYRGYRFRRSAQ